jgi:hypothetical protein
VVGVSDAIELWTGKGEIVPEKGEEVPVEPEIAGGFCHWELDSEYQEGGSTVPPEYWSSKYQWLPANLAFQEDGTVKFTSYINNLHPKKYPNLYRTIERLIDTSIPAWDQCLSKYKDFKRIGAGRQESRFSQPESCEWVSPNQGSFIRNVDFSLFFCIERIMMPYGNLSTPKC